MVFIRALVFGATLAIAIGPIALLIIRYAATDGVRAGFSSACGAALADFTYAVIALSVGTVIAPLLIGYTAQVHKMAAIVLITFGLWLIWTAFSSSSSIAVPPTLVAKESSQQLRHKFTPLFTTYTLTVTNPLTVIAFLAFIGQLPPDASLSARVASALGLFTGSLVVQIVLVFVGMLLGRMVAKGRGIQMLNVTSGIGILLFGVVGLFG